VPDKEKAAIAWSTGKDAAWALHVARAAGRLDVVAALTTVTDADDRVTMHGVRAALLDEQVAAAGLPVVKVRIPTPCPNETYDALMGDAVHALAATGVTTVVFGDLFLQDVRAYREARLAAAGLSAVFPLWGRDTSLLAREMLGAGLRAVVTCVDPRAVDRSVAGKVLDTALLDALPAGVDRCGENGELHTFAFSGPMFAHDIRYDLGEVVERDGFVFADLRPAARP
jgi:uncharacterized protein (TIGR00290 family)